MRNTYETIARENFCSSGYLTHPKREPRASLSFSTAPQRLFHSANSVRDALQRRERASRKAQTKPSLLANCLNALFHR